jgi:hypothetical protein
VPTEQQLAGVGGWLLVRRTREQAANVRAMAVVVPVNRWTLGRAWPEARLSSGNSIEVILPIMSWAYASGQRQCCLDGHLVGS